MVVNSRMVPGFYANCGLQPPAENVMINENAATARNLSVTTEAHMSARPTFWIYRQKPTCRCNCEVGYIATRKVVNDKYGGVVVIKSLQVSTSFNDCVQVLTFRGDPVARATELLTMLESDNAMKRFALLELD